MSKKFAIIIGHEKNAPGANGHFPDKVLSEYVFYKEHFAPKLLEQAKKHGLDAKIFLRDGLGIGGVGAAVSKWADIAIELHFNAADKSVRGSEVLYDSEPHSNKAFAQKIQDVLCSVFGRVRQQNRGIKKRDSGRGSHNLTSVKCIGCLIEPVFGDNKPDAGLLWDNQDALAIALADAVAKFNG